MRVSSSGTRSVTRTMRTRSRQVRLDPRQERVGVRRQSRAWVRSSASSPSWCGRAGQLTQPSVPPGGSSSATRSSRLRSTSKSARSWPAACTPTRSGTASLSTYTRCKGGNVGVGDQQEATADRRAWPRSGRGRGRVSEQAPQQLVVVVAGPLEHLRPTVNHDDDAIAHARSTPGQQAATSTGPGSADSPEGVDPCRRIRSVRNRSQWEHPVGHLGGQRDHGRGPDDRRVAPAPRR